MRAETGKWWLSGGDENKKIRRVSELRERTMKINVMELFFRHQKSNAGMIAATASTENVKKFRNFIPS